MPIFEPSTLLTHLVTVVYCIVLICYSIRLAAHVHAAPDGPATRPAPPDASPPSDDRAIRCVSAQFVNVVLCARL